MKITSTKPHQTYLSFPYKVNSISQFPLMNNKLSAIYNTKNSKSIQYKLYSPFCQTAMLQSIGF